MSTTSQFAEKADTTQEEQLAANDPWRDVDLLSAQVRQAELTVSRLSLERDWRAAEEAEALAIHNELWHEECSARAHLRAARKMRASDAVAEEETEFLRSWADAARELRHSDAVDWRYIFAAHQHGLVEEQLSDATAQLQKLQQAFARALRAANGY